MVLSKKLRVEKRFLLLTDVAFYFIARLLVKKQLVTQITRRCLIKEISVDCLFHFLFYFFVFSGGYSFLFV
jgi:hypothetical protein